MSKISSELSVSSFLAIYGYAIFKILNSGSSLSAKPSWLTTALIIKANLLGTLKDRNTLVLKIYQLHF